LMSLKKDDPKEWWSQGLIIIKKHDPKHW
jgi:hypothetical protein